MAQARCVFVAVPFSNAPPDLVCPLSTPIVSSYHQLNQDVYLCFEKWVDSATPAPTKSKSKSQSLKEPTLARFTGGGGLTSSKLSAVGKRNSHKDKMPGKSKMHAWCVFDGHDMLGEAAAQIAAQTFEHHLNTVRSFALLFIYLLLLLPL